MESRADLSDILRPVIERMGYIYWGLRFQQNGKHSVLQVYIDHADGITLDDCSQVSNQLSGVLDVEDVIRQSYTLEVSSPGIDRPLLANEHYELYVGTKIKVKSYIKLNNRKNFTGLLEAANDRFITVKTQTGSVDIPYQAIKQGHLLCENWNPTEQKENHGK